MNRLKTATLGAIALGVLVVAVPAAAFADHGSPKSPLLSGPAVAYGSVASTDTSDFVLAAPGAAGSSFTINVDSKTRFVAVNGSDNATFSTGDDVYARGGFVNGFYARTVWYDSVPFALPGGRSEAIGTGVSNVADQLVITDFKGNTDAFTLNSDTKFRVNGKPTEASSVPSVTGDKVAVQGAEYTDGSDVALRVTIRLPKPSSGE